MIKTWTRLAAMIEAQGIAAMVTVAELSGSGPREVGARMLVACDGQIFGTIGGGRLEWQALAEVQRMMTELRKAPARKYYALGPELGQCCGGAVTLFLEIFDKEDLDFVRKASHEETEGHDFTIEIKPLVDGAERIVSASPTTMGDAFVSLSDGRVWARFENHSTPVWLFGAGHVGHALVNALAPLPFHVTWLDSRADQFQETHSQRITCITSQDPVADLDRCPTGVFVVIMTHSHELDFELCEKALRQDRYGYVGVIGSKTKAARFRLRLKKAGLDDDAVARLVSPLGVATIKGKEPSIVATSIACQLLEQHEMRGQNTSDQDGRNLDKDKSAHA
jgi:xanthine dehydrogenase accessory factor